ncbi:MAG: alpha/beta fold hydrolase [Myxococcales bacterium]|nr:alpha/beta fold hydrolase [Myxococcales bacterium]
MWNKRKWQGAARRVTLAAQNALELIQAGRLSEPYTAGYDVLHSDSRYSLRRYQGTLAANRRVSTPLLLIPPLMLTAEIYDISEELSAAATLVREGVEVWVTDFRTPEEEEGGLTRTLDDHVIAVSDAIDRIREITRRDVHLAGYSQGGMFAYQCAAHRRSEGIASVITFGSPVDIHRTVPNFGDAFAERVTSAMRAVLGGPLARVEGLPGALTSLGFKTMGMRKELGQFNDFLGKLHDRQALEKREAKRLFLRGDGFVAWPGPAFRTFVDEFIVANRMATGGFVIDGKTVSLADIECPILCFIGERDEIASPAAVRAIHAAAPNAEVSEVSVVAGHFGLVVGSESLRRTWPTVVQWVRWRDDEGCMPAALCESESSSHGEDNDFESMTDDVLDFDLALDVVSKVAKSAWHRTSEIAANLSDSANNICYQVSRLSRLRALEPGTHVSFALAMEEQAAAIPERTFFLWKGRAFSYSDSNERVDNIVKGLIACGVMPTQRVGVLMRGRPSYLSLLAALNRIGAVAVLMDPKYSDELLLGAFDCAEVALLVVDPDHAARANEMFGGEVFVLGGGSGARQQLPAGVVDMEEIEPSAAKLPAWYQANPGRARDLAMIIISSSGGRALALHVTNHRWAFSAYGAGAAATLTAKDTVYCCLPLHHAAGTMVSVGSALVSGARVALAEGFIPSTFWQETRRYGATVVFYAGEMCRQLVDAPHDRSENSHPIRLFAGSGMRKDVWERVGERFGPVGVLEFYAATETNAVLANVSGQKIGSVGSPMPGSSRMALVRYDFESGELVRGAGGFCIPCPPGEPGLMLVKVGPIQAEALVASRVLQSVFSPRDCWYSTGNLLSRDIDGDYWFAARTADLIRTSSGRIASLPIEDRLYDTGLVSLAAAYGKAIVNTEECRDELVVAVVLKEGAAIDAATLDATYADAEQHERPVLVLIVEGLPMSDGYRPKKSVLRGADPDGIVMQFRYQDAAYRPT